MYSDPLNQTPKAPDMDREQAELVGKILDLLKERKLTFREAKETLRLAGYQMDYMAQFTHL
ncbi:hypothetical protein PV433_25885 [Paenibacillus sp. GYB004]|uniref:hypothetical protein n=1 Tax=Paenibacillus sp. GYB004 TaxID=2994393 RepID=UPI002F960D6F